VKFLWMVDWWDVVGGVFRVGGAVKFAQMALLAIER